MIAPDDPELLRSIRAHEGFRAKIYTDTTGHLTVGYGVNISNGITVEMGEALLRIQVRDVHAWLCSEFKPWFQQLSAPRQRALVEMAFQLGPGGFKSFKRALGAIRAGDWERASIELLDSKWYRQTPRRAEHVARLIREG